MLPGYCCYRSATEEEILFDLVLIDVHTLDMDVFKLLEFVGLEMNLPSINDGASTREGKTDIWKPLNVQVKVTNRSESSNSTSQKEPASKSEPTNGMHMLRRLGRKEGLSPVPHKCDSVQPEMIAEPVVPLEKQVVELKANQIQIMQTQERMGKQLDDISASIHRYFSYSAP
ncbi:hypothetical protein AgCh_032403 [Apium graveolens]